LHLINNLKREGAQMVVFNLATAPDGEEVRHAICAREPKGPLQAELEQRGIPVYVPERYYGARETRRSLRFVEGVAQREAIDVVHAHMADAAFLGWRLARVRSLPLVITHHGHDLLPSCGLLCRLVYQALLTGAAHYAARNIAVSPSVAQRVRRRLLLGAGRVSVLGSGVPVPSQDQLRGRAPRRETGPHVVTVGRLVELKGHEQLIAAASIVVKKFPDARFSIVGDGPLHDRLRQQAESLGLGNHVTFAGSVSDVPARLREADIYVSASHYEGMPMATLEAMAWGVPVIASDVPGNRAIVEDGRTGLLYPLGNAVELADRIRDIVDRPVQAVERARLARNLVEERHSAAESARHHMRLYAEVVRPNHARARPSRMMPEGRVIRRWP
jgi:glycosyltransferase involved in cell wall biosynthesis